MHEGKLNIEVDGVVVPFRQITLSAEVEGTVLFKEEDCRAGRYVEQGTVLFRIDPRDYELEIRRLWKGFAADGSGHASEDLGEPNPHSLIGLAQQDRLDVLTQRGELLSVFHGVSSLEMNQNNVL